MASDYQWVTSYGLIGWSGWSHRLGEYGPANGSQGLALFLEPFQTLLIPQSLHLPLSFLNDLKWISFLFFPVSGRIEKFLWKLWRRGQSKPNEGHISSFSETAVKIHKQMYSQIKYCFGTLCLREKKPPYFGLAKWVFRSEILTARTVYPKTLLGKKCFASPSPTFVDHHLVFLFSHLV